MTRDEHAEQVERVRASLAADEQREDHRDAPRQTRRRCPTCAHRLVRGLCPNPNCTGAHRSEARP